MSDLHRQRRKRAPARTPSRTVTTILSLLLYGALLLAALLLAVGQPGGAPSSRGGCPPATIQCAGFCEPRNGTSAPGLAGRVRAEPVT
jgi:hypothetical protein